VKVVCTAVVGTIGMKTVVPETMVKVVARSVAPVALKKLVPASPVNPEARVEEEP
jgi:hypothetical protein